MAAYTRLGPHPPAVTFAAYKRVLILVLVALALVSWLLVSFVTQECVRLPRSYLR